MHCIKSHLKKAEGSQEKRATTTGGTSAGLFGGGLSPMSIKTTSAEPDGQAAASLLLPAHRKPSDFNLASRQALPVSVQEYQVIWVRK